jgi:hypothetical protein
VRPGRCRGDGIAAINRQRFVEERQQCVERLEVSGFTGAQMLDPSTDPAVDQVGFGAELHDEGSANRREWTAGVAQL